MQRACQLAAVSELRQAKKESVSKLRHALAERVGSDTTAEFEGLPCASAEEAHEMSEQFNCKMVDLHLIAGEWYLLFKAADTDQSGRISYTELKEIVRGPLQFSKAELPAPKLKALWKALDEDSSGWISAGEFGRFMRKGEPEPLLPAKERMLNERIAAFARQRAERRERIGIDLKEKFSMVQVADEAAVGAMSRKFNTAMEAVYPDGQREWYVLWRL